MVTTAFPVKVSTSHSMFQGFDFDWVASKVHLFLGLKIVRYSCELSAKVPRSPRLTIFAALEDSSLTTAASNPSLLNQEHNREEGCIHCGFTVGSLALCRYAAFLLVASRFIAATALLWRRPARRLIRSGGIPPVSRSSASPDDGKE